MSPTSIDFHRVDLSIPMSRRFRKRTRFSIAALGLLIGNATVANAAVIADWKGPSGTGDSGSWATDANWSTGTKPNGVGDTANFLTAPATRAVTLDAPITLSALSSVNNANFTVAINNGTGTNPLTMQATSGSATITIDGTSTSLFTLAASQVWNSPVTVNTVTNNSVSNAGALTMTGSVTGTGGLTKTGPGILTMASGGTGGTTPGKVYTGPTVINDGRLRLSVAGTPASSSSFTVNPGGQLVFTGASGTFTLGAGVVNLNGNGLGATSPIGFFPGAIRADQVGSTIPNAIVLQSDAIISMPAATATLALPGGISGPGRFEVGGVRGNPLAQGSITITGTNSYTGGTLVDQGELILNSATTSLGSGNVTVDGSTVAAGGPGNGVASGRLTIKNGVLNAIADTATLTLTGDDTSNGGGPDGAPGGFINLDSGINEVVSALVLGTTPQIVTTTTTYGSTASNADVKDNRYFSGAGVITVAVPEPGSIALIGLGAIGLIGRRRRR
jgi:fibronectin-binding autotransporter adhesin